MILSGGGGGAGRWVNCSNMAARAKAACAPSPQEAVKGESFGIRPPAAQRDWNRCLSELLPFHPRSLLPRCSKSCSGSMGSTISTTSTICRCSGS